MAKKPTYEELEQRVNEIEKETVEGNQGLKRFDLLSRAVEQSSEGIAVTDLNGNLLYLNNSLAKIHGYSPEEIIGKNLSIFHTPEQMPSVKEAYRYIKETGSFSGEIWHFRRDGTVFPTLMNNSILRDDTATPIGIIGTVRDITELKRAEAKIEHLNLVLRAIRNVNQLIIKERDRDRLLKDACDRLIETRGYYNAWIVLLDKSGGFVTSAEAGLGEGFLDSCLGLDLGFGPTVGLVGVGCFPSFGGGVPITFFSLLAASSRVSTNTSAVPPMVFSSSSAARSDPFLGVTPMPRLIALAFSPFSHSFNAS